MQKSLLCTMMCLWLFLIPISGMAQEWNPRWEGELTASTTQSAVELQDTENTRADVQSRSKSIGGQSVRISDNSSPMILMSNYYQEIAACVKEIDKSSPMLAKACVEEVNDMYGLAVFEQKKGKDDDCDGIDNDCDGAVSDDHQYIGHVTLIRSAWWDDDCDGIDNDCDGAVSDDHEYIGHVTLIKSSWYDGGNNTAQGYQSLVYWPICDGYTCADGSCVASEDLCAQYRATDYNSSRSNKADVIAAPDEDFETISKRKCVNSWGTYYEYPNGNKICVARAVQTKSMWLELWEIGPVSDKKQCLRDWWVWATNSIWSFCYKKLSTTKAVGNIWSSGLDWVSAIALDPGHVTVLKASADTIDDDCDGGDDDCNGLAGTGHTMVWHVTLVKVAWPACDGVTCADGSCAATSDQCGEIATANHNTVRANKRRIWGGEIDDDCDGICLQEKASTDYQRLTLPGVMNADYDIITIKLEQLIAISTWPNKAYLEALLVEHRGHVTVLK